MAAPELHRFTLPNGLRVVLAPDRTAPVVGVSVHYDVGFRSEPEGAQIFTDCIAALCALQKPLYRRCACPH